MRLSLFIFICLFPLTGFAQPLGHVTYSVNENLPSNFTKSLTQDQDGLIWIATDGGLVRFDGEQMVTYTRDLPSLLVKSVLYVPGKGVYVLTDRGLCLISRSGFSWKTLTIIPGSDEVTDSTLHFAKTLYHDRNGKLWLGESDAIVSWDGKKLTRFTLDPKYHTDSFSRSFAFFENEYGDFYAASWGGVLFHLDSAQTNFVEIPLGIDEPVHRFYAVSQIGTNRFWLGTKFGIYELSTPSDPNQSTARKVSDIPGANAFVWEGGNSVWAGTLNSGLFRLKMSESGIESEQIGELGLKTITSFFLDNEKRAWVTSDEGVHLFYTQYSEIRLGATEPRILKAASKAGDRSLLVTDFKNLILLDIYDSSIEPLFIIRNSEIDLVDAISDGKTIWVSYRNGELKKISGNKTETIIHGMDSKRNSLLTLDHFQNLWGREEQSRTIFRVDPTGEIKIFGVPEGIASAINSIRALDDSTLYLTGNGNKTCLFKWNRVLGAFDNISPEIKTQFKGVLEIYDIEKDKNGNLLLGTNDGIYRVNNRVAKKEYPENPEQQLVVRTLVKNKAGWVWSGTERGLLVFTGKEWLDLSGVKGTSNAPLINHGLVFADTTKIFIATTRQILSYRFPSLSKKTFPPIILSLTVNGADDPERIYSGSAIEISFQSPVFPAEPVNYQYRIIGVHQDWINLGRQNQIHLSGLEADAWQIEFRAQKAGATWSDIRTYQLDIVAPFYYSLPAKISYVLAGIFLFWISISSITRFRTRKLEQNQKELQALVSERTSELREEKNKTDEAFHQLKEKEKELHQSLDELTEANQIKAELIGMASHELRNPLQSILGYAELLETKMGSEKDKESINRIHQSAQRMLKLVNSLVDSQVLETGNLRLSFSTINMADIVQSVILQNYPQAEKKNQTVFFDPPDHSCLIKADENALREIIDNILNNAIKYSSGGSVIRVKISPMNEKVRLSITDQGPGLSEDDLEHLFKKFRKLSAKPTGGELSTGLGLSIVKKLTDMHDGKVWAESHSGSGSTFHVEFPRYFSAD
ncbi:MAG: hypothetical protein LCH54_15085 [Bacteroidetes bacterium]|nr:hypothetical protein [Bacteroidota bacterium]